MRALMVDCILRTVKHDADMVLHIYSHVAIESFTADMASANSSMEGTVKTVRGAST